MAKTQGKTTADPRAYTLGADVLGDGVGLEAVSQQINWGFGLRSECHASECIGQDGWDDYTGGSGNAIRIAEGAPGAGAETIREWYVWVDKDEADNASVGCGTECNNAASNTVRTVYTIVGSNGTITPTIDCDDTENGTEQVASDSWIDATPGDEWVKITVTMQRTVGSGTNEVRTLRVETLDVTSPPTPAND